MFSRSFFKKIRLLLVVLLLSVINVYGNNINGNTENNLDSEAHYDKDYLIENDGLGKYSSDFKTASKLSRNMVTYSPGGYVYARGGSAIAFYVASGEYSSNIINNLNNNTDASYPLANRLASASALYNCHSYAWYFASTNGKWINDPLGYINDAHTEYLGMNITPSVGNIIVYRAYENGIINEGAHSAIVTSVSGSNVTVKSKWGQCGVYSHAIGYCPYLLSGTASYRVYRVTAHSWIQDDYGVSYCPICGQYDSGEDNVSPFREEQSSSCSAEENDVYNPGYSRVRIISVQDPHSSSLAKSRAFSRDLPKD